MIRFCRIFRWFRWFAASPTGTSAVEFALIAPIFIMLFLGMTAYGVYFGASHSVQQLAADAARTAVAGLNATERSTLASNFVRLNASGYPFVDPKKVAVESRDSAADGSQFVVAVRYDASNLPIWKLFKGLPMPGMTISRQSTIRVGGI